MRLLAALFLALIFSGLAQAQPVNTGHLIAELVPEARGVAPGQTVHVALRQDIQEGWHTYWRNPGDSGEATRLEWALPSGWRAGEFVWAAPQRLPFSGLLNYGYEGEVLLPLALTAPADARPGQTVTLKAKAFFLVCEKICIPESADLQLALPVTDGPAAPDAKWGPAIREALAKAPKPAGLTAAFQKEGASVKLAVTGAPLKDVDVADAYFFPYSPTAIKHEQPQAIERGPEGLTLTIAPGYDFEASQVPAELAGVLSLGGVAYEVTARAGPLPAAAAGLGPPMTKAAGADLGLITAVAFALAGGLILNLMPCVFPVLAMKAASLARHGGQRAEARRQGLAFGAGVVVAFALLAGALIVLKAAGAAVGWGFQLQAPPVVAFLALLMLGVALNLSGVFEVGGSLQNAGSGLAARGGSAGAFFTGALAVLVAAPCTAPFMGPALGWALTQPAASALAVFLALGVGFALPFVLVAFTPGLLSRLPRPGPWMDVFRKALAFPMYAAAGWLAWVLTVQSGADALARLLAAAVVLALAAWLAGAAQRRTLRGGRSLALAGASGALALAAMAAAVVPPYAEASPASAAPVAEALPSEPYTPERLAALRAEGRPVFVNYTAAWCVSCKANERLALSTRKVAEAMRQNNVAYLKADWTNRDDTIAADLARFGRAGVPLYVVYGAGRGEPDILPPILTEGRVIRAIEAAARPS